MRNPRKDVALVRLLLAAVPCALAAPLASACDGATMVPDAGCADPFDATPTAPALGILQFQVEHNLAGPGCLEAGSCSLTTEVDYPEVDRWIEELQWHSNIPVLHWDHPIPWLVFDEDCPDGRDCAAFYETHLPGQWAAWLDAFARSFAERRGGYLAVSLLNGGRNGIQPLDLLDDGDPIAVGGTCPDLSPGELVTVQLPTPDGPVTRSFQPYRAYRNFVFYLATKLRPRHLALLVEANLYAVNCPDQWDGLVTFYHDLYDEARAVLGPDTSLFATLTYKELLAYHVENCMPLEVQDCGQPPAEPGYQEPDPLICYPLNLGPLRDLDEGRRLDLLALSFYPDALLMRPPGFQTWAEVYPRDWDGSSRCTYRIPTIPYVDPFRALDRIEWDRPVAMAEFGARSCPVPVVIPQADGEAILVLPGSENSQDFWLRHALFETRLRKFPFFVASFLRDYPPIGVWAYQEEVLSAELVSLFNSFACMGLYLSDGGRKQASGTWAGFLLPE